MVERRALMLSVGLACLAMYLVFQYIQGQKEKLEDEFGLATSKLMVVTTRDILMYETIKPSDVTTVRVPKAMIPPGMLEDPKDVVDAVAAVPMMKGEQVLDNKVISKNVYSGLDTQITLGRRAISIPVNPRSANAFLMRPGNRVDVAAFFEYQEGPMKVAEVKVFLQDLLVLAAGRTIQTKPPLAVDLNILRGLMSKFNFGDSGDLRGALESLNHAKSESTYPTATLEVTPNQAQILAYVQTVFAEGMTFYLRHTDDRSTIRRSTTNLREVLGPESLMNRGKKLPPAMPVPRVKFYDMQGGSRIPIQE
jgi:Flp pilus assembly protein CpaB